ncbi:MAG TPA: DUF5522 domain-containing protein [Terracidiphilus sp.]|nr:DUF5522 domain-containing protein [Terracidiphilus sp.]
MDSKPSSGITGSATPLAPEDYYFEGLCMVFTAAYHLKRGSCCNSGCRHCPYRPAEGEAAAPGNAAG